MIHWPFRMLSIASLSVRLVCNHFCTHLMEAHFGHYLPLNSQILTKYTMHARRTAPKLCKTLQANKCWALVYLTLLANNSIRNLNGERITFHREFRVIESITFYKWKCFHYTFYPVACDWLWKNFGHLFDFPCSIHHKRVNILKKRDVVCAIEFQALRKSNGILVSEWKFWWNIRYSLKCNFNERRYQWNNSPNNQYHWRQTLFHSKDIKNDTWARNRYKSMLNRNGLSTK